MFFWEVSSARAKYPRKATYDTILPLGEKNVCAKPSMQTLTPRTAIPVRLLHLEDSELDHQLVIRALQRSDLGHTIERVDTLDAFAQALQQRHFDVILADFRLPGFTAEDAWRTLQSLGQTLPFILVSGAIGESAAVEAMHLGMSDYVHKDALRALPQAIRRAIEVHQAHLAREQAVRELAASEQRLSELAGHLQSAIENERAAIAREIHDDIGGSLAAAKLDLAWLGRHVPDDAAQTHIAAATDMLQLALGASQRIMLNLRPDVLDQGLLAAVQWLAHHFEKRTGIPVALRADRHELCLQKPWELVAYRTAQEALTNIAKHAQCSQVRIDISDAEGALTLEISDNGCGIDDTARRKPQSFGLKGLQERAKSVGGWVDISSQSGTGTSIVLTIPTAAAGINTPGLNP